jgi:hypothetical protein
VVGKARTLDFVHVWLLSIAAAIQMAIYRPDERRWQLLIAACVGGPAVLVPLVLRRQTADDAGDDGNVDAGDRRPRWEVVPMANVHLFLPLVVFEVVGWSLCVWHASRSCFLDGLFVLSNPVAMYQLLSLLVINTALLLTVLGRVPSFAVVFGPRFYLLVACFTVYLSFFNVTPALAVVLIVLEKSSQ